MFILKNPKNLAIFLTVLAVSFFNVFYSAASALSSEQRTLFNKNVLYYDLESCNTGAGGGSAFLVGADNAEKIFNFFVTNGYTPEQAAGIVGNASIESGLDPQNIQNPGGRSSSPNDAGGSGYGLFQFTPGTKLLEIIEAVNNEAGNNNKITEGPGTVEAQVKAVLAQLESKAGAYNETQAGQELKATRTVKDAAHAFQGSDNASPYYGYERPADKTATLPDRIAAAEIAFNKFSGNAVNGVASQPLSSESCACLSQISTSSLSGKLKDLSSENGGQTQISVSSIDGQISGNSGGDVQMPTRSSYKVYTAYATLKAIEEGKISWSTRTSWGQSVEATMEAMIIKSDNNAAEALRTNDKIGTPQQVTNLLQGEVGLSEKTVMGSGNADDPAGSNSKSTANDFTKFLTSLQKHKLPGVTKDTNYEKLLSFMKKATTDGGSARDGIVAGVGADAEVADKPGWAPAGVDQASNDVGIVYKRDNPYVISILTDKPNQWSGVAKIAKDVNSFMGGVGARGNGCGTAFSGDLSGTIMAYAWPEYHDAPYTQMKPEYKQAVQKAQSEGRYVGGINYPGVDCGGFVTTAMIDSGFEPRYNSSGKGGNTIDQEAWLRENWQKINPGNTRDLQPGDVAINSGHTYMYVGRIPGFNSDVASSSLDSRAPMAGHEAPADPGFNWYRKK